MQRPRVRDDDPHAASEAETLQVLPLPLQIVNRIGLEHPVLFEKTIELVEDLETEQTTKLGLGQPVGAIGFDGQGFKRLPLDIAAGAEPLGEIVRYMENEIHQLILPRRPQKAKQDV
jgi:hypothetical protein